MTLSLRQKPTKRIRRLTKADAPEFTALIGENALREPFGGPAAMAEQLAHLQRTASEMANVTVRVIRSGGEAFHPAHAGHFGLMRFLPPTRSSKWSTSAAWCSSPATSTSGSWSKHAAKTRKAG
ncbi:Scr1 family TA system antitoxin-like transcriptional regulator [Saccharopolyspora gloriosae]|uniref:Scr1 family TA system antitoxin-like transcriptional regulator n=1 Tax=Saccharopolyspora gloriosae TaxID=455344 RepID=UPI0037C80500